jgi:YVTN family beta-propeller protein
LILRRTDIPKSACGGILAAILVAVVPAVAAGQSFVNFESGQVRPLALSAAGDRLYAVNTPDNRLEVFSVAGGGLTHLESVPVGLEPVAVAVRNAGEVWVVNHLSDSISIVDVAASPARVVRTLLTCDEPRDILFAGAAGRAFVTTARRGQNCAVAANLTTEGIGRAVVQVFDPANLGATLGGTPVGNVVLFGDTPRALAKSGNTVYAAVFHSGNRTTAAGGGAVCDGGSVAGPCGIDGVTSPGGLPGGQAPGGLPFPNQNQQSITGPEVGLVVKFNPGSGRWEDELGRNWNNAIRFDLPDLDVFAIDATSLAETDSWASVGTILFNMAVNPVSGRVYVSNTDANNHVRFEGPGITHTTVNGNLHKARISVLDSGTVTARHLNKHIDYDLLPAPAGVKEDSLATPLEIAVTADGATLYVAAFGSAKIGVFSTAALEANSFLPSSSDHVELSGGGPTGVVLDEASDRLYVLTRFDNSISVIDTNTREEVAHLPVRYTPEPAGLLAGRRFLYDAEHTSSNGEASCAACHVFGDFDSLVWDLGNPDDDTLSNPNFFRLSFGVVDFHPLKGPMTTQTLRGMATHGPMHWRGDRTGGNFGGSPSNEDLAFKAFNPAFVGLVGRNAELPDEEMQAFTDFILTVLPPPNPIRALDNSLSAQQLAGRNLYFGRITDVVGNCDFCHRLDPAQGFFGTDGFMSFENETQDFKIAHLRNAYAKVGMFGTPTIPGFLPGGTVHLGPQVRGTGFLHDGSIDSVFTFLSAGVFDLSNTEQRNLEAFTLAFDSNLAPVVGQQITRNPTNAAVVDPRIDLLLARDQAGECEVIVKGVWDGAARGAFRLLDGTFQTDRELEVLTEAALRAEALVAGQALTYTCVPPGSGERMGIDRDEDGALDRDELDDGFDPADPSDGPAPQPIRASLMKLRDPAGDPNRRRFVFRSAPQRGSPSGVVVPAPGGALDPTLGGAALTIFAVGDIFSESVFLDLPASLWQRIGSSASPGYRYRDTTGAGPIKSIVLRNGRLSIRGSGPGLYSLADAPQGEMAIALALGDGHGFCASAPARVPASTHDSATAFNGEKGTTVPTTCPDVPRPPVGSASEAFLTLPDDLVD